MLGSGCQSEFLFLFLVQKESRPRLDSWYTYYYINNPPRFFSILLILFYWSLLFHSFIHEGFHFLPCFPPSAIQFCNSMHLYNAWLPPPVAEDSKREREAFAGVVKSVKESFNPDNSESVYSTLKWVSVIDLLSLRRSWFFYFVFSWIRCAVQFLYVWNFLSIKFDRVVLFSLIFVGPILPFCFVYSSTAFLRFFFFVVFMELFS